MGHRPIHLYCAAAFSFCGIVSEGSISPVLAERPLKVHEQSWTRRSAQIAEILPQRAEEFRKASQASGDELAKILAKHRVTNESTFVKELTAGEPYAFRFTEYAGTDRDGDLQRLHEDSKYRDRMKEVDACLAGPWVDAEEVFFWAGRTDVEAPEDRVKVFGQIVGLRPETTESYKLLHAHAWPEVLSKITEGNMRDYAIYLGHVGDQVYLFAYFEYVGTNYDADMAMIDADKATQAWTKFTDKTCQLPIPTRKAGEWWADMDSISILHAGK